MFNQRFGLVVLTVVCIISPFSPIFPDRVGADDGSDQIYQLEETVVTAERMVNPLF